MGYRLADDIIETAIKAMTGMMKDYSSNWTRNYPWNAPEYLFTTEIARAIVKKNLGLAYPESNMGWTVNESRLKTKTRFKKGVSKDSRLDIMVADTGDKMFRFCIEVKKHSYSLDTIVPDLEKCAEVISSTPPGTIDDAAVIFFRHDKKTKNSRNSLSKSIKTTLIGEGKMESEAKKAAQKLEKKGFRLTPYVGKFQTYTYKKEEYDWVVGAVRISMPKKRSS